MRIHWHRRDLRIDDNRGLADGTDETILPVFVFDPSVLEHAGPPRIVFLLDAITNLRKAYREQGGDLIVAQGDPEDVLVEIANSYDADAVSWNRDYSPLARQRDSSVRETLEDMELEVRAVHDGVLHKPGSIRTNAGDPYQVFTYFWRKWRDMEKEPSYDPPDSTAIAEVNKNTSIPAVSEFIDEQPEATIPEAHPETARDRLETFCEEDIYRYKDRRDYPADECTSRLSAHLKWGTIGIREVFDATESAYESTDVESDQESVREFQSQLAWRDFYAQVLWFNPHVVTNNYKSYDQSIEWRDDPSEFSAWKMGETGYPIVDAGMRQLRSEAFMHNRVRMIVASFLTKDLMIDWRKGYEWFRKQLVDHDTANDNGGWQWAASTGTDAQPYFRIFNPMTQGQRYDPDCAYIQTYVPELRGVDPDIVHDWTEISAEKRGTHASEYPHPVVDHGERREKAIAMFERARGDDE